MHILIVSFIIALATLQNILPLIAGYLKTPPNFVFLGTVHHPVDYLYYLSQFAQGSDRWLTTIDLYTPEAVAPSFVGWTNVLLGRLFHLVGLPPVFAYHASLFMFTILLFITAYKLSLLVLGKKWPATIALYFFALFHSFPMVREGKSWFADYWNNIALPRVRFGGVPHQLLITIVSMLIVYLTIQWTIYANKRTGKRLFALILASAILASLQPAAWGLVIGSIGITVVIYVCIQRPKTKELGTYTIPLFFLGVAGLLPVLYLYTLFGAPPFIQLKLWEVTQQTFITIPDFILATGPIFVLTLMAAPFFLFPFTFARLLIFIYSCMSLAIFFSPLPALLTISDIRFMSALLVLCFSIIAASGLSKLSDYAQKRNLSFAGPAIVLLLTLLTVYLLPNHMISLKQANDFPPDNAYDYLQKEEYKLFVYAGHISNPTDTFLIIWPYDSIFPAISGRRSYHGHPLLTIDAKKKDDLASRFFNDTLTAKELNVLVSDNHITYIITYSWNKLPAGIRLVPIKSMGALTLYRVTRGN